MMVERYLIVIADMASNLEENLDSPFAGHEGNGKISHTPPGTKALASYHGRAAYSGSR